MPDITEEMPDAPDDLAADAPEVKAPAVVETDIEFEAEPTRTETEPDVEVSTGVVQVAPEPDAAPEPEVEPDDAPADEPKSLEQLRHELHSARTRREHGIKHDWSQDDIDASVAKERDLQAEHDELEPNTRGW